MHEALRMTAYFGDRDRAGGRLLADELMDVLARHEVRTSVLLRGIEGFGVKHLLASERLLTLSEDLPLIALAVDEPKRMRAVAEEAQALCPHGAIAFERAVIAVGPVAGQLDTGYAGELKLTVYVGRGERIGGASAHRAIVACLHRHGVAGASVLLGLDGTVHGERRRARLLARNTQVPVMIQSVGEARAIVAAIAEIAAMGSGASGGEGPAMTLERVRVCKRDGELYSEPPRPPDADGDGLAYWQRLVVYTSEHSRWRGQPMHSALVRRLRAAGAAGATALRGQWGYHGAHEPHGEAFWSLSRRVPVLTVLLDTPANVARWFEIVDEMTAEVGLVTCELVPALRAGGAGVEHGGIELAARAD